MAMLDDVSLSLDSGTNDFGFIPAPLVDSMPEETVSSPHSLLCKCCGDASHRIDI